MTTGVSKRKTKRKEEKERKGKRGESEKDDTGVN
jgi:hypothetical protein